MRVITLGGLALEGAAFTRPKPLMLLAYLALEGRQERRQLAGLFWPHARDPLGSLTVALSQLRAGAPGAVRADRTFVWTCLPCDAVEVLESLHRAPDTAAELGDRGQFLAGVAPPMLGIELEEWIFRTREFLALRMHRARLRRAEALAGSGRWRAAAAHAEGARPLIDLGPEPEDLARLHTLLLAVGSDHAKRVREEALAFDLDLAATGAEARARLRGREGRGEAREVRPRPLPEPIGGLVGREHETDRLTDLLREPHALVSITGAAGVGKSRLALHVARELDRAETFEAGVAFLACAPLRSPHALPHAVADAFGIVARPREDPLRRIAAALGDRAHLLVCDEPEHLIAGTAWFSALLSACPGLRVLVATRTRLRLDRERIVPLTGLAFPSDDADPGELERAPAVRFFVRHARRVRPWWRPSADELRHVGRVCRAVEGLPLGLELAATWIRALPLEEIGSAIENDLDLLASDAPDAAGGRRSAAAALERSWNLLEASERRVMRRLAVLRGSFTRHAASAVAAATIATLARLVDASLLRCDASGRFDRHPLMDAFVRRKLRDRPDERRAAAHALADHALDLVATAARERDAGDLAAAYRRLEDERENLWAAFEAVDPTHREDAVTHAIDVLGDMFEHRARADEGAAFFRTWIERWCAERAPGRACAHALVARARLARCIGAFADAERAAEEALGVAGRIGDERAASAAHQALAVIALHRGAYRRAHEHAAAAVTLSADDSDPRRRGTAQGNLALASQLVGRRDEAVRGYEAALRAFREAGDELRQARAATNLGLALFDEGRLAEARRVWESGLALAKRTENRRDALSLTSNLGMLHAALGDLDAADDFDGHALRSAREAGDADQEAAALMRRAQVARRRDDPERAEAFARGAVEAAWRGDEAPRTLESLKVLADAWVDGGERRRPFGLYRFVADHPATADTVREQARAALTHLEPMLPTADRSTAPIAHDTPLGALVARIVG
jgi:predicted ATPase